MGVQMIILPFECNQQLIWKGKKNNNNKVVVPTQTLQEIIAHSEHLHAPTADLAFATDPPWQKLGWVQKGSWKYRQQEGDCPESSCSQ